MGVQGGTCGWGLGGGADQADWETNWAGTRAIDELGHREAEGDDES